MREKIEMSTSAATGLGLALAFSAGHLTYQSRLLDQYERLADAADITVEEYRKLFTNLDQRNEFSLGIMDAFQPCSLEELRDIYWARNWVMENTYRILILAAEDADNEDFGVNEFPVLDSTFAHRYAYATGFRQDFCDDNLSEDSTLAATMRDAVFDSDNLTIVEPSQVNFAMERIRDVALTAGEYAGCELVYAVAHEAAHAITSMDQEPDKESHNSEQDDWIYLVGATARSLCNEEFGYSVGEFAGSLEE